MQIINSVPWTSRDQNTGHKSSLTLYTDWGYYLITYRTCLIVHHLHLLPSPPFLCPHNIWHPPNHHTHFTLYPCPSSPLLLSLHHWWSIWVPEVSLTLLPWPTRQLAWSAPSCRIPLQQCSKCFNQCISFLHQQGLSPTSWHSPWGTELILYSLQNPPECSENLYSYMLKATVY